MTYPEDVKRSAEAEIAKGEMAFLTVANAILAERKRCVTIVRAAIHEAEDDEEPGDDDWLQRTAGNGTAERIAREIEAGA